MSNEARRPTPSLAARPDLDLEARRDYQRGYIQGRWDATQSLVKQAEALWNPPPILIDASNIDPKFLASLALPSPAAPLEALREIRNNAQFHIDAGGGPDARMAAVWVRTVAERGLTAALSPSSTAPSPDAEKVKCDSCMSERDPACPACAGAGWFWAPSEGKEKGPDPEAVALIKRFVDCNWIKSYESGDADEGVDEEKYFDVRDDAVMYLADFSAPGEKGKEE